MTMFGPETPNRKEKLQKKDDDDLRRYMESKGQSDEVISSCIRQTRLFNQIDEYRLLLYEDYEIIELLLKDGWGKAEIEEILKEHNATSQ